MPDSVNAELVGYTKDWTFVRVPEWWPTKILSLPRDWLKHGFASQQTFEVHGDPQSLHHDGHGWVGDIEIVGRTMDTG